MWCELGTFSRIPVTEFKVEWKKYGRAAGPIRNKAMLDYIGKSGLLIAFPGCKGTANVLPGPGLLVSRLARSRQHPLQRTSGRPAMAAICSVYRARATSTRPPVPFFTVNALPPTHRARRRVSARGWASGARPESSKSIRVPCSSGWWRRLSNSGPFRPIFYATCIWSGPTR